MRLSADQIKQGILHADVDVRDQCLSYFQSGSDDPSLMPLFIQAYEQFGWAEAFGYNWPGRAFAQSVETVRWLVERLSDPAPGPELVGRWKLRNDFLSAQLSKAPLELLEPHREIFATLPGLDAENRDAISERFAVRGLSPEGAWKELEVLCEGAADGDFDAFDCDRGFRYVELAARDGARLCEQVLSILEEGCEPADDDDAKFFRLGFTVDLAGRLRLQEAAPLVIDVLVMDAAMGGDWLSDVCTEALICIGIDDVIEAVAEAFPAESVEFQFGAIPVLRCIHSDAAVEALRDLLFSEPADEAFDEFVLQDLANALINQFDPDDIEPLRQRLLEHPDDKIEQESLREALVVVATLAGVEFPEIEAWREEMRAATRRYRETWDSRTDDDLDWEGEPAGWETTDRGVLDDEAIDDDLGDFDESDDYEELGGFPGDDRRHEPELRPFVNIDAKVGRNDPCPCGSGKKFKKCCLNRQQDEPYFGRQ